MTYPTESPPTFTPYRPVVAEGARIGLMSCVICGAVVMLDPANAATGLDPAGLHQMWHERMEPNEQPDQ